jgi:hypothetical protein
MSPTTSRRSIVVASEFLAHLHTMSRASRRQQARIQLKAGHLDQAELRLRIAAYKRLKPLLGNALARPMVTADERV